MPPNLSPTPRELFDALVDIEPRGRESWFAVHCPKDIAVRARVSRLLAWHDRANDFLERPLITNAANLLEAIESLSREQSAKGVHHCGQGEAITETLDSPAIDRMIGRTIGRYTIHRLIAVGGMGAVYEAQQDRPRRPVALKLMRGGIASRSALRRFEYESQLLARLRHPGIAQVYDAGTHNDGQSEVPYFAMEYIPAARRLTDFAREEKLGTRQRLDLFARVCDAVHHGHQKGIIHRDLKPSNILVDSTGNPKVIDFGVARSTDSDMALTTLQTSVGQLIGTLQYMSPEQCAADPHDLDTRSDVYALGIMLYELLCGRPPYDVSRAAIHEAARVIREQPPTRMSSFNKTLRGDLETIVLKALEKDRKRRYQSANDLGEDIRHFLKNEAISARVPSAVYLFRGFAKRHRAAVAGVVGIILALTAGLTASTRLYLRSENSRKEADAAAKFLGGMIADVDPRRGNKDVTVHEILDRASLSVGEKFRDQPLTEAYLRQMMANSYLGLGSYSDAVTQVTAAEAIRRRVLGDEHPSRLESLRLLASTLLHYQMRIADAVPIYQELLPLSRRVLGDEAPATLEVMFGLAQVTAAQGSLAEAETMHHDVLTRRRRVLGDDHPDTLKSAVYEAETVAWQGRWAEAEQRYRKALDEHRRVLGDERPDTLDVMGRLAGVLGFEGKGAEAADLHRRVLEIRRRVLGDEHPDTMFSLAGLAAMDLQQGRYAEAEQGYRTVVAHYWRDDDGNPLAITAANELAEALTGQGHHTEADELHQRVLDIKRRTSSDENWGVLLSMHNVAHVMARQGRDREAQDLYFKTLETRRRVLGEEHGDTQDITNCTAWWLMTCKSPEFRDPRKALALAEHVIELNKGKSPYYLETLALAQYMTGDVEHAVESHSAALALLPSGLEPIDCELKQILAKYLTESQEDSKIEGSSLASPEQGRGADTGSRARLLASLESMVHVFAAEEGAR